MTVMNDRKIAFIMCSNDEMLEKECRIYIENLIVPQGYETEVIAVHNAKSMTSGYNQAMKSSDAKYKVYLHHDVLIVCKEFIENIIDIFVNHADIGMIGMVGNTSLASTMIPWESDNWEKEKRVGCIYADLIAETIKSHLKYTEKDIEDVIFIDGLLMATQYDVEWREDLFDGWDLYDGSQTMEFWKAGYRAVVPKMKEPWVLHDNDILNLENYDKYNKIFKKEYKNYYQNWINRDYQWGVKQKVVYQIMCKKECDEIFPYPPMVVENDADYICFTDIEGLTSNYWKIVQISDNEDSKIKEIIELYPDKFKVEHNQIIVSEIFGKSDIDEKSTFDGKVVTIPDIYHVSDIEFNKSNIVPTCDENGDYIYEKNPVYQGGKYDGRDYILTIGVPVSNQIETIERCMKGIEPLLRELDAELVVVDTGSNDGTIEVCEKYGARVVKFPWCNNMSAARNQAIHAARGEWYMSIDDDEWFEDVDDILQFFQSGKYKKYKAATYIQKNYTTSDGQVYLDYATVRMVKMTEDTHFEGRIHDALDVSGAKDYEVYPLSSYAHHYGFLKEDNDKIFAKYKRNVSILLMDVYEYPSDLRFLFQLANEYANIRDYVTSAILLLKVLSMERELSSNYYGKDAAIGLIYDLDSIQYKNIEKYVAMLRKRYEYSNAEKALINISMASVADIYEENCNKIIGYYEKYLKYKSEYEKNRKEDEKHTFKGVYVCNNKVFITDAHVIGFRAYCRKGDEKNAIKVFDMIDMPYVRYKRERFVAAILNANDDIFHSIKNHFEKIMPEQWLGGTLEGFLEMEHNLEEKSSAVSEKVIYRFIELLSLISIETIGKININQFDDYVKKLMINIYSRIDISKENIQILYFLKQILRVDLTQKKMSQENKKLHKDYMNEFLFYVNVSSWFAQKYYNDTLLNDEKSNAISADERAVYQIYHAIIENNNGNTSSAAAYLRKAIHLFEGFKEEIQYLLNEFINKKNKEISESDEKRAEREMKALAIQIKAKAQILISNNKKDEAREILNQLLEICPNDKEARQIMFYIL